MIPTSLDDIETASKYSDKKGDVYYNKAADVYSVLYRTPGIMDENGEEGLYRVTLKRAGDHWQIMANTEI